MSSATPLVGELVPAIVARPRIHGTLRVGQTLSTGGGSWSTLPERKQYSWLRCRPLGGHCAVIPGATAPRYTIHRADAGHALRVAVTASTTGGSARAVSPATGVVRR
jgi:hypothetical protein